MPLFCRLFLDRCGLRYRFSGNLSLQQSVHHHGLHDCHWIRRRFRWSHY